MQIDWDVPLSMDDGVVLRADIFRPDDENQYPVIMTHGPYAKSPAFGDGFPRQWTNLQAEHPDALAGTSGGPWPVAFGVAMRGNGIFVHDEPADRLPALFGGTTALLSGGGIESHLLLPGVPARAEAVSRDVIDATREGDRSWPKGPRTIRGS